MMQSSEGFRAGRNQFFMREDSPVVIHEQPTLEQAPGEETKDYGHEKAEGEKRFELLHDTKEDLLEEDERTSPHESAMEKVLKIELPPEVESDLSREDLKE